MGQGAWGTGVRPGARLTVYLQCSPSSSSPFCRNAATSLSLFYNNGALPCGCHEVGALSPTCEPFGGQCPCRGHVIGRDCSRCATGYWGFPNCRREYPVLRESEPVGMVGKGTFWSLTDSMSLPVCAPQAASSLGGTHCFVGLSNRV